MNDLFKSKISKEGLAKFKYYYEESGKISKELPVFYNPKMKINRDFSNLFIYVINKNYDKKIKNAASLMSASGIREIRWFLELDKYKPTKIILNDLNENALNLIKENLKLNQLNHLIDNIFFITKKDARFFDKFVDYMDLDPFGSPLPFLQPLIKSKYFKVTATDLAVLCRFKKKSLEKYGGFAWKKNDLCKIQAVKILINKVIDFLKMHELNAKPLFFYYYQHHFTIFFEKKRAWTKDYRQLFDEEFLYSLTKKETWEELSRMIKEGKIISNEENFKILKKIVEEFSFKGNYYYLPSIFSKLKMQALKREELITIIKKEGFKASVSHVSPYLIKSNLNYKELINLLINYQR